jgi:hypothetical protein
MLAIEPYLFKMIIQLEKMRVPISSRQGVALANSMISGTVHEKKFWNGKKLTTSPFAMVLGKGYWADFMK